MRLIFASLVLIALLPATAAAQDPVVTTGPAASVGQTTATLTGTIDPGGSTRLYRFEYGTTAAYGLTTIERSTGAGDEPVAVEEAVQNLMPSTTYHFRLVAAGIAGADRTFTSAAAPLNPAPPGISRLRVLQRTATSARLRAVVDPNRAATTWHVEWGRSIALGNRTPDQMLPAGDRAMPVSVLLGGLPAYTRVYWRLVAVNAAGVRRSGRTSFVTARAPTSVTLSVFPRVTIWSRTVAIAGRVEGAGVGGMGVALQQSSFPFAAGYHQVAATRSGANGEFGFAPQPVFLATRFRAVTMTAQQLASAELGTRVRSRVTIRRSHWTRRSVRIGGGVNPGLPAGRATLQRRTRADGWKAVARRDLQTVSDVRSEYRFGIRRKRRALRYRVMVAAHDGGAHARGYSRPLRVARRR